VPTTTFAHRRTEIRAAPSLADGLPPESRHAENSTAEADWIATRIESIPGTNHPGRIGILTRSALAEKIGSSPAYVTKILKGETNFTLDSMVKIANALNCELTIGLQPFASSVSSPPPPRSKVSYRQIASLPSSVLNDKPKD
jgi:hypothetical protein